MLVKGFLLFITLAVLSLLLVLSIEYFLWLNSQGRLLLLGLLVGGALYLLFKFILTPLFYLFKLKHGISNKEASLLIGKHFPEVGDKLFNLLDLAEDQNKTELLLASIEQRSQNLNPIPFSKAIDLRENLKYLKYLAIPVLIFGAIWISGHVDDFFTSYNRVVNYDLAYEPPAPFEFKLLSGNLEVLESEAYILQVTTEGRVRPENMFLVIDDKEILLQEFDGLYQYTFSPPIQSTSFSFIANGIKSRDYSLIARKTPSIQDFTIDLKYPGYLNRKSETLRSSGNATVPEGTEVSWNIVGQDMEEVTLKTKDTTELFLKDNSFFSLSRPIFSDLPYEIITSNSYVANYETLAFKFTVVKDAYPTLQIQQVVDSINPNVSYFVGEASDDHRLSRLQLTYYPEENDTDKKQIDFRQPKSNFEQFYYTFPSGLQLEPGKKYNFFFTATDNDALHKGKSTNSQIFGMTLLDEDQLNEKTLESQQSILNSMDKSLEKFKVQKETLKELNEAQKEKSNLNFNDQNQIKDFIEKQQQQENMMQKFSKQLKENLNKGDEDEKLNKLLQERLERQEKEAIKNEKLLEELKKIADKINKEELTKRLEELGKKQQNSERSLEQLLELTKRYYITEKANQLAKELEKQAERQEVLSELKLGEEFSDKEQKKLNEQFNKVAEALKELDKDNSALKKPLDLEIDKSKEAGVKKDQQEALEEINKHKGSEESSESQERQEIADKAKQKQKSAAQKMKEMSNDLGKSASAAGGGSTIAEDADMLRQILDNLVTFSFKQENLYDAIQEADVDISQFSATVRSQQQLRDLFGHVDDSLFALSLRRAEVAEFVNEQITEVYYNIDKALESISENQMYQGASYQQYALNASNSLADFLAKLLDNMQQSMMPGKGEGQGQNFQLPDIIKGQGALKEKMEGMGQQGKGKPQEGEGEGQQGKGEQQGENGDKNGEKGEGKGEGKDGKQGEMGEDGKGQDGQQSGGEGQGNKDGPSESELEEIYEIYKEQQQLRNELEKQLQDMINADERKLGEKLIQQMEDFENDLLENGITQRTVNKMNTIQHQLLKLENAALKQGEKKARESNTNKQQFGNPIITKPSLLDNYINEIEILNRQALPLQPNFQNKVKDYFKQND